MCLDTLRCPKISLSFLKGRRHETLCSKRSFSCLSIIEHNAEQVVHSGEFLALPRTQMRMILDLKNRKVSEALLFERLVAWVKEQLTRYRNILLSTHQLMTQILGNTSPSANPRIFVSHSTTFSSRSASRR